MTTTDIIVKAKRSEKDKTTSFPHLERESISAAPAEIREIQSDSVQRIVAGQAVTDLASAVKELVDNALDAGARNINIRLFDCGLRILEVSDDGSGVPPVSRPYLATPHATSKISCFDDIYKNEVAASDSFTTSLGFRGEALFCLANLSNQLIIATRTADEELAQKLEFKRDGSLNDTKEITRFARKIGTTVAVLGLLEAVPVRRADLERRLSAHRNKLVLLMEAYAIFAVGRRICLMDVVGKNGREQPILATTFQNSSLRDNVSSVLGSQAVRCLCELPVVDLTHLILTNATRDASIKDEAGNDANGIKTCRFGVKGLVSDASLCLTGDASLPSSSSVRQYFCINGRPVELPKLARQLNEIWRNVTSNTPTKTAKRKMKPFLFIQISLPNSAYDINLSPDKRQVLINKESEVFGCIQKCISGLWSEQTQGCFRAGDAALLESKQQQKSMVLSRIAMRAAAGTAATLNDEHLGGDTDTDVETETGANMGNDDDELDTALCSRRQAQVDCSDVNDHNNVPTRFNRRYAFAHDITRIRLQHEFDDGRSKWGDDDELKHREKVHATINDDSQYTDIAPSSLNVDKFDPCLNVQRYSEETTQCRPDMVREVAVNDIAESRLRMLRLQYAAKKQFLNHKEQTDGTATVNCVDVSDRAKVESIAVTTPSPGQISNFSEHDEFLQRVTNPQEKVAIQTQHVNKTSTENLSMLSSSASSMFSTLKKEYVSPSEQRNWRAMQRTFNEPSFSSSDMLSQQNEVIDTVTQTSIGRYEQGRGLQKAFDMSHTSSQQTLNRAGVQSALERFGFRPMSLLKQNMTSSSEHDVGVQQTLLGVGNNKTADRLLMKADTNALSKQASILSHKESLGLIGDEDTTEEAQHLNSPLAKFLSPEQQDGFDIVDQQLRSNMVWNSFSSTKDIVMAARQERIMLRDRKRKLQEVSIKTQENSRKSARADERIVSLSKDHFRNMTVIGQFNLGFILVRSAQNDLWILDQHACDEKYNFEKLCAETIIHEQRLIAPMPLELSPSEETCVMDNMEIFEKNGFRFAVDETKPPRNRLSLTALPHSGAHDGRKAVQFSKEDVSALCSILSGDDTSFSLDGAAGSRTGTSGNGVYGNNAVRRHAGTSGFRDTPDKIVARLPKAIAMFASRACRGSIMIGTSLAQKEMERVVQRLAEVENPWSCPHGRPTMKHVGNLQEIFLQDEKAAYEHIAGPTLTFASTQDEVEPFNV